MAYVLCLAVGACAWACSWLIMGGGTHGRRLVVRYQLVMRACARASSRLADSAVTEALLAHASVREVVGEMAVLALGGGREVGERQIVAFLLVLVPVTAVVGRLASRSLVGAIAAIVALLVCLRAWASSRVRHRKRSLAKEMPAVLRTMATALESGNTLVQAVEYVGLHEGGQAAEPFVRTSLRLRCGMSMEAALEQLRCELDAPGVALMVTALAIAQRTGSPLRALLQRSAVLVEQQEEFERLLAVRTAQVRLSVRIVCCLPVLMVCLLAFISPDYQQGILSGPGMASLVVAGCMDGVALLLIRRILEGVM